MAKPGRKPLIIPRRRVDLYIRVDLLAEVELMILDPVRDKAKYGQRSMYIEKLIEEDLNKKRKAHRGATPPNDFQRFLVRLKFELQHWDAGSMLRIMNLIKEHEGVQQTGDSAQLRETSGSNNNLGDRDGVVGATLGQEQSSDRGSVQPSSDQRPGAGADRAPGDGSAVDGTNQKEGQG